MCRHVQQGRSGQVGLGKSLNDSGHGRFSAFQDFYEEYLPVSLSRPRNILNHPLTIWRTLRVSHRSVNNLLFLVSDKSSGRTSFVCFLRQMIFYCTLSRTTFHAL